MPVTALTADINYGSVKFLQRDEAMSVRSPSLTRVRRFVTP